MSSLSWSPSVGVYLNEYSICIFLFSLHALVSSFQVIFVQRFCPPAGSLDRGENYINGHYDYHFLYGKVVEWERMTGWDVWI